MCDNKKKCDMKGVTLGFIMNWNFAKKVRHEKCDPWFYMNWNFAQKSATWKVWPLVLYELKFCSKECDMKCVTIGCKACQIDHACLTKTRGHTFHVALFVAKFLLIHSCDSLESQPDHTLQSSPNITFMKL